YVIVLGPSRGVVSAMVCVVRSWRPSRASRLRADPGPEVPGEVVEAGDYIDAVRVDEPLVLQALAHGQNLAGDRLVIEIRAQFAGIDSRVKSGEQHAPPDVEVLEEVVAGRVTGLGRFGAQDVGEAHQSVPPDVLGDGGVPLV